MRGIFGGTSKHPHPELVEGPDVERRVVFADVFRQIENRIKIFCALPIERLSRLAIQHEVTRLGQKQSESAA